MIAVYPSKKVLKENIGKPLKYRETSMFGEEYKDNGTIVVVMEYGVQSNEWYNMGAVDSIGYNSNVNTWLHTWWKSRVILMKEFIIGTISLSVWSIIFLAIWIIS
mgnify:CR=1 FL=1